MCQRTFSFLTPAICVTPTKRPKCFIISTFTTLLLARLIPLCSFSHSLTPPVSSRYNTEGAIITASHKHSSHVDPIHCYSEHASVNHTVHTLYTTQCPHSFFCICDRLPLMTQSTSTHPLPLTVSQLHHNHSIHTHIPSISHNITLTHIHLHLHSFPYSTKITHQSTKRF